MDSRKSVEELVERIRRGDKEGADKALVDALKGKVRDRLLSELKDG